MFLQRATIDVFHHQVAACFFRSSVIDFRYVRMRQLTRQRCFSKKQLLKALADLLVLQSFSLHELDRHFAIGKRIARKVYDAGRALTQFTDDLIFADFVHLAAGQRRARKR